MGMEQETYQSMQSGNSLHVHGVSTAGEVESAGRLLLASTEGEASLGLLGSQLVDLTSSLILIREVLLNDVVGLHVDLLVGVVLAVVDLLHATSLLNEERVAVDAGITLASLLVHLTNLQDVLKAIQSNLDDLVIGASEQITKGLDASLRDKVADLVGLLEATRGGIGDSPAGLLAGLEITVGQKVDKRRDDTGVDDGLNLAGVSGSDVGDGPASLLANAVLSRAQKREQSRQGTTVDDDLGLNVVTSDYG